VVEAQRPGEVAFANPSSSSTTATMTVAGAYQLQLSANDGEATSSDVVTITVNPAPNAAPTVDRVPIRRSPCRRTN
jgi:hypothetical protein